MKNLLNQFVIYLENDEYASRLDSYSRILKSKDWQFVKDVFQSIRGEMALDLLSSKFTEMNKEDKDSTQRAYFVIDQLLAFLSDPNRWVRKKSSLKNKFIDLKRKVIPKREEGA